MTPLQYHYRECDSIVKSPVLSTLHMRGSPGANSTWRALAREAGIGAEHIAIGMTALGKADFSHEWRYSQAFFALSVGFERTAKLELVVDYALRSNGKFPPPKMVRDYGHDLRTLFDRVQDIAARQGLVNAGKGLPGTPIHKAIIDVLSDFAGNVTRYYNLDFLTGATSGKNVVDPISDWFRRVIDPILATHYAERTKERDHERSQIQGELLGPYALVRAHDESGNPITSVSEAAEHAYATTFAISYTRLYVGQLARFLAQVIDELSHAALSAQLDVIPVFSDFYRVFLTQDRFFRELKTWTIH